MIVLLLGTNPYPFGRLLDAVDAWAAATGERVLAQTGHTPATAPHVESHDFVPHATILQWLQEAELVICQGGFGSLRDCIRSGKPTIAVPRRPELGESQDDQAEIVDVLAEQGLVVALHDVGQLPEAIARARTLRGAVAFPCEIPRLVAARIEAEMAR